MSIHGVAGMLRALIMALSDGVRLCASVLAEGLRVFQTSAQGYCDATRGAGAVSQFALRVVPLKQSS